MMPSAAHPIPLYGVRRYNVDELSFDPYGFTSLGTIHLLRSYAKITVECPTAGWNLSRVSLTLYNTVGRCAPENVRDVGDYVHNSYAQDYVGTPHLVSGGSGRNRPAVCRRRQRHLYSLCAGVCHQGGRRGSAGTHRRRVRRERVGILYRLQILCQSA